MNAPEANDRPLLTWTYHVSEAVTDGGLVVGPDQLVADAGAEVLRAGGNAVDAAVAGAFATTVVEPPMSGIAGGATMTIALRDPDRLAVVEGHMVAPLEATSEHYPLTGEHPPPGSGPWSVGFYDWPMVEHRANFVGPRAVAAPGALACLCTAQERYGRLRRDQVLAPAIRLAADGYPINWYMAAVFAVEARSLARDPGCREVFLPGRTPPRGPVGGPPERIVQAAFARTLEAIAAEGPDLFYRGRIGRSIVETVRAGGGLLSMADLEGYQATVLEPTPSPYGRFDLAGSPTSGFPTMLETLYVYDAAARREGAASGAFEGEGPYDDAVAWAHGLRLAFEDRFRYMTGDPAATVPWEALRSQSYARARLAAHLEGGSPPAPEPFSAGAGPGSGRAVGPVGHTSQVSCVDRDGNLVSLTITLQGGFGARLMDPDTGIVLNSGMSYFDPRPDALNGIRPGAVGLSAMTPVVLVDRDRGPVAAVGAAGGRRIVSGVAQIVAAMVTGRLSLQEAIEAPQVHAESDTVLLDVRWPPEAVDAVAAAGYDVVLAAEDAVTPFFARANGVAIGPDGTRRSGLDPRKPGGAAIA